MPNEDTRSETEQGQQDFPDFYVNAVKVIPGVYEIFFTFGLQNPESKSRNELFRLRMSPQHAKAMSILLNNALEAYENAVDQEIRLPEPLLESLIGVEESEETNESEESESVT
jgi:hypothetical protein